MLHLISEVLTKVNRKTLILGVIETLIIFGLTAALIFRSPAPTIKTQDNEKPLRDSIAVLMKRYDAVQQDKVRLGHLSDSLIDLKTNIQIIYQTRIKYIQYAPLDTVVRFVRSELAKMPN
jgi:hypothetical protein